MSKVDNKNNDQTPETEHVKPLDFTGLNFNSNNTYQQIIKFLKEDYGYNAHLKYSKEDIRNFLLNAETSERQLRRVSLDLAKTSNIYMRIIMYMAKMLTLDYAIYHYNARPRDIKEKLYEDRYLKTTKFLEDYNIKHELGKVLVVMMLEDVFFGYERRGKNSIIIQRLPSDYCRLRGVEDGVFVFDFDMSYFDDTYKKRGDKLKSFPKEFTDLYKIYLKTKERYQPLDTRYAVCFKFREDLEYALPPFTSSFSDIYDLEELKELENSKNKLDNFMLFIQKIPFKKDPRHEADFLMTLESIRQFHNNFNSILPSQIGLVSTPMEVEKHSFESNVSSAKNRVKDSTERVYDSSGVPSDVFNPSLKSAVALNRSIQTDESMMFGVLRQFERFYNKRIDEILKPEENDYSFRITFPNLSVYNEKDKRADFLKMAQYGFPKTLAGTTMGLSPSQLVGLNELENEFLDLDSKLIPLNSSHTKTAGDDKGGKEKNISDLSDKGQETRDSGSNIERDAGQ